MSALSTAEPCRCAWAGLGASDASFSAATAAGDVSLLEGVLRRGGPNRGRRHGRMSSFVPGEAADSGWSPVATSALDISLTQERPRRRRSQRGFSGIPTPARAPTQPWPAAAQSASRVRFADDPATAPLAAAAAAALAAFNAARTLADDVKAARADAIAARAEVALVRTENIALRAEVEQARAEVEKARADAKDARASAAVAASENKRARERAAADAPSVGGGRAKKRAKPDADAGAPRAYPAWVTGRVSLGERTFDDGGGAGDGGPIPALHSARATDISIFTSPESDVFAPPVSSRTNKTAKSALQPIEMTKRQKKTSAPSGGAAGGRSVLSLVFCGGAGI